MSIDDIDAIEINEAFAPVVLAWIAELSADPKRVNPTAVRLPSVTRSAAPAPGS